MDSTMGARNSSDACNGSSLTALEAALVMP